MRTPGACCSMTQRSKGWYSPGWGLDVFKVPSHTSSHWVLTKSRVLSRRTWFSSRRCEKLRWRKRCAPHSPAGTQRAWGQARVPPVRLPAQRGSHDPSSSKAPEGGLQSALEVDGRGPRSPREGRWSMCREGWWPPIQSALLAPRGHPASRLPEPFPRWVGGVTALQGVPD